MDKNMTLEKRIDAELYSYQGRMSVFVDDLQGHTVERGADEEFETARSSRPFCWRRSTCRPSAARRIFPPRSNTRPASSWTAAACCVPWAWEPASR